jgi:hypothetical protein
VRLTVNLHGAATIKGGPGAGSNSLGRRALPRACSGLAGSVEIESMPALVALSGGSALDMRFGYGPNHGAMARSWSRFGGASRAPVAANSFRWQPLSD